MEKISKSQIQAAVAEIQAKERLDIARAQVSQRSQLWALRRDLRKRLQPVLVEEGFNINKINEMLTQHQKEVRQLIKKQKTAADKDFYELNKQYRYGVNNRRRALDHINGLPLIITPIVLDPPFSIYATPSGMLVESDIAENISYAKIRHFDDKNTTEKTVSLKFFFAWQNQSDYAAVINAKADLIVRGFCRADAETGLFLGGSSSLSVSGMMKVHLAGKWWYTSSSSISSVATDPSGVIFGGTVGGDFDYDNPYSTTNLSCSDIIVKDGELVIFEVGMWAFYGIDDGSILLDFSSSQDYFVTCPELVVELLTSPTMATSSGNL